jgi:hypothetical protein
VGPSREIVDAWALGRFELVASPALLGELGDVLAGRGFAAGSAINVAPDFIAGLEDAALVVEDAPAQFTKVIMARMTPRRSSALSRSTTTGGLPRRRVARFPRASGARSALRLWTASGNDRTDPTNELTQFFTTDFVEPEVAERFARGLDLFWDGQPDESAHVLAPRLERVVREIACQVGIPVVREPRPGREIGGVEMLGILPRGLERAFLTPDGTLTS